jgi:hypothetical protein
MVSFVATTSTVGVAYDDLCLAGIQVMQEGGARWEAGNEQSFPSLGEMLTIN